MNGEWIVKGEVDYAGKPKTPLAKYFVEFNDLVGPQGPHRRLFLKLLDRSYALTLCEKVSWQTR